MRPRIALVNNSSANTKSSKTKLHKIGQPRGLLGKLLGPILKTSLSLIKKIVKALAESALIPLGLIVAAPATDVAIQNKCFVSSMTSIIISNKEMNDIMKVVKSLEESGLLIKGARETVKTKSKEQKDEFFSMLLGTQRASLLGNLWTGQSTISAGGNL